DALRIAAGRVRLRVQILAPSNRPVQITENLADFWRDTYPKLKPQLQRRYPQRCMAAALKRTSYLHYNSYRARLAPWNEKAFARWPARSRAAWSGSANGGAS